MLNIFKGCLTRSVLNNFLNLSFIQIYVFLLVEEGGQVIQFLFVFGVFFVLRSFFLFFYYPRYFDIDAGFNKFDRGTTAAHL